MKTCYTAPGLMSVSEQIENMTIEQKILFLIENQFEINSRELLIHSGGVKITCLKHIWRYLLRSIRGETRKDGKQEPKYTFKAIGRMTGMVGHPMVIWSCKQAQDLISTDKYYRDRYAEIVKYLKGELF